MDYLIFFFLLLILFLFLKFKGVSNANNSFEEKISSLENEKLLLVKYNEKLKNQIHNSEFQHREQEKLVEKLKKDLYNEEESRRNTLSQKKSSEVRLGHIAEKLAPFLDNFPYDPKDAIFLGQPIDYIVFDDSCVVFVEIKTGKSRLSSKQKRIKELIKDNHVKWEEIRIE